jgi:hypothetical protein
MSHRVALGKFCEPQSLMTLSGLLITDALRLFASPLLLQVIAAISSLLL